MKGSELKELREKYGLLPAHVAEMFEVSRTTALRWEVADKLPRLAEYVARAIAAEEGLAKFVATRNDTSRRAILRRGNLEYVARIMDLKAVTHDDGFYRECNDLKITGVMQEPSSVEKKDSGIHPLDEYRRDSGVPKYPPGADEILREAIDAEGPDYATGPLVENIRKDLAAKFRAGGQRALLNLSFRTDIPSVAMKEFSEKSGELTMEEFGRVCRIIKEDEDAHDYKS